MGFHYRPGATQVPPNPGGCQNVHSHAQVPQCPQVLLKFKESSFAPIVFHDLIGCHT
jgi:hypothetical protein